MVVIMIGGSKPLSPDRSGGALDSPSDGGSLGQ
jgi:hypothetical protein